MSSKFTRYARGARKVPFTEIPVIDVAPLFGGSPSAFQQMAAAIDDACRNVGFFYIKNHGVAPPILDNAYAEARRFFALPAEDKKKIHYRNSRTRIRGFIPLGDVKAHIGGDTKTDLQEGFDYGVDLPSDDPDHVAGNLLYGPNQWPENLPSFRVATYAYFEAVVALGKELFRAFASALALPEDYFVPKITKPLAQGRVVYYPPSPNRVLEDTQRWGVGEHCDYECFTILAQDEVGGLQVRNSAGQWIEAPPLAGTFLINLGDMMARWTNGLYQSTPHRVLNRSDRGRYSLVFFYGANYDTVVECLPTCRDPDHPPRYNPVSQGAWTEQQLAAVFLH